MKRNMSIVSLVAGILLLAGCASSVMIKAAPLAADGDFAVVNFIRPSLFGGAIKFGVWDGETVIGVLTPQTCIQYKASPGEHTFLIRAENWGSIAATVEAGKTYTVLAEPRMGIMKANVHMTVIRPGDKRLKQWMAEAKYVAFNPKKREAYARKRSDEARAAADKVESGKVKPQGVMTADDGE